MIAIPNIDKPKGCDECVKSLDIAKRLILKRY